MSSKPKSRPRQTAKPPADDTPVRITVDMPRSLHYRLRLAALQNRQSASEIIRTVLDEHLPMAAV
jgi:hypothetical protein